MPRYPNSEIERYGVIIIESLSEVDIKTGSRLYNDLLRYRSSMDRKFFAELHTVTNRNDFFGTFRQIIRNIEDNIMISIHIEAHGGELGIQLASKQIVTWAELHNELRPINIQLLGLLSVAIATCYSFPFTWSINITKRASFKTVVFTKRDMIVDEIERGFLAYYEKFSNLLDSQKALAAIQEEVNDGDPHWSPFQMMVADWAFDQISNPDNNPNFKEIVMTQYVRMRFLNPAITPDEVERCIRKQFAFIRKHGKDFFLLKDLFDKNSDLYTCCSQGRLDV